MRRRLELIFMCLMLGVLVTAWCIKRNSSQPNTKKLKQPTGTKTTETVVSSACSLKDGLMEIKTN